MKIFSIRRVAYFLFLAAAVIALHYTGILSPVERVVEKALNPMLGAFYGAGVSVRDFYDRQAGERDLIAENERLQSQLNQLVVENARLNMLEEENRSLRQQLDFAGKDNRRLVMVNVNSRTEVNNVSQGITIDRGSADGLSAGLPVISGEGLVIGKIMETKEHLSEVCLVTASRCQFAATVENQNKTMGLTKGELGLTIRMEYIPQTEEIKPGELVVTSGLEKNVPRGLVLGKISEVEKNSKELWQSASIEPMQNLNNLVIASVIMP